MTIDIGWPVVSLALGITVIGVFRKQLAALLDRTEKVKDWISAPKQPTLPPNAAEKPAVAVAADEQKRVDELTRGFDNELLLLQEDEIRADLSGHGFAAETGCEKVLVRHLAGAQIQLAFERLQSEIYGSQVRALRWLNGQPMGTNAYSLRPFYESAVAQFPLLYDDYGFESWLAFLAGRRLIVDAPRADDSQGEESVPIGITVFGRAFLGYLVSTGRADPYRG